MPMDPDGINAVGVEARGEQPHQLEPSGSRQDEERASKDPVEEAPEEPEDSREEPEALTLEEMKKLIGVPPPPPPGEPPKRKKKEAGEIVDEIGIVVSKSSEPPGIEQTFESRKPLKDEIRDETYTKAENPSAEKVETDVVVSNETQVDENIEATIVRDIRESPVEEKKPEENVTKKDEKRKKKRGFFKKLFRGGKSRLVTVPESKPTTSASTSVEEPVVEEKSIEVEQEPEIVQVFSLDPPDNDNGDPPQNLGVVEAEYDLSKDPVVSMDPLGSSPVAQENTRINQLFSGDPQGATPKARACRIGSSDPIGESYCHESKMRALEEEAITLELKRSTEQTSKLTDFEFPVEDTSKKQEVESSAEKESLPQPVPAPEEGSEVVPESIEVTEVDLEKSGFKSASTMSGKHPLTVTAAAFTNAQALAYIHQLQGEPSPRNIWHSKSSIAPPLSEKDISLAKIRAFSSKRKKKGKIESAPKITGPSPDEYSATNAEITAMIKEKTYVKHDPNMKFAAYSRFKGRLPRKETDENKLEEIPPSDILAQLLAVPVVELIPPSIDLDSVVPAKKLTELALTRGAELRRMRREGIVRSVCEVPVAVSSNQFNFFPLKESTIKNPVQRAGRRLLSKAAVPIQAGFRMYLSKKETTERMWALIQLQSYFRRWKCEAYLREHKKAATMIQKTYRGIKGREDLKNRHRSAVSIQKIVRGYLAALHAYEAIFFVTRAQALARGFLVRAANARKARELKDIVVVQSIARRWLAMKSADLMRKSVHSAAITKFQALWRGYAGRNRLARRVIENAAATKIQATWRGYVAYSEFVFALVDILIVQRSARQWLAIRKTNTLRQERANIVLVQSVARRYLAKNEVEVRRKEYEQNMSVKRKKDLAATAIQKAWRGFWGYSHFVIVKYETTRIQALIRGKLERNKFNLKLGCAIIIQAAARRFLVRRAAANKVIEKAAFEARVQELRERNSAIHIQFWWRIVLDWMKEKKAALVIERFFIHVKSEVDRELRKMERERIMLKKNKKKVKKNPKLDKQWVDNEGAFSPHPIKKPPAIKKNSRSQSAPGPRPPKKTLVVKDTRDYKESFESRDDFGFLEDMEVPLEFLNLAPSCDFSMVSGITNPQFTNGTKAKSEELYQEVKTRSKNEKSKRLSTDDYIKKYSSGLKTAPNKTKSQSHFFSEEKSPGDKKKRQSLDGSTLYRQRQSKVTTPRNGNFEQPFSLYRTDTSLGFEVLGKPPATPRSSSTGMRSGSRTPRNGSTPRNSPTPRNRSRMEISSKHMRPPTPTRKKAVAILHSATALTECSTPVEQDKMHIPPRPKISPRKTPVRIMKTTPDFMDDRTFEEAHEIMLLSDDYGEV